MAQKMDSGAKSLRKFGATIGTALGVITLLMAFKHKPGALPLAVISLAFFILGLLIPGSLRYIYILWMRLAFVLGWVNTRLILALIFYLIFTPIGLVLRVCGRDLLDRKIKKDKTSYWLARERKGFNPADYERQF